MRGGSLPPRTIHDSADRDSGQRLLPPCEADATPASLFSVRVRFSEACDAAAGRCSFSTSSPPTKVLEIGFGPAALPARLRGMMAM